MNKRLPPLQSLLAFEATASLGSFSRAAAELALTQSAISHQIAHLESWAGQALFHRTGRGVTLTAAGELFGATVRSALKTLRDGRERIEPYRNPDSVLLACDADFAAGWLMPRLRGLRALHPALEVWLITRDELREIDRIDVDLIISSEQLPGAQMQSLALLEDHALAVCGPETALRLRAVAFPEVLLAAPLIVDEHAPEWSPWLPAHALATARAITLDDAGLRLAAAQEELGIAMVSRLAADGALRRGLVCALPQVPTVALPTLWLTRSTLAPRTPAVQLAFDWLRAASAPAPA
ncbi:MAG TPA: LysR family transcriptional regulator [Janthinobacterium sp.]|nr:LysR family transcriptional regulator [Janthinobacterium sp.]